MSEQSPAWLLRLAELPAALPDYVLSTSLDGTILWTNPAFERLMGRSLVGEPSGACRPAWVEALLEQEARPVARAAGHWVGRTALRLPDGRERPVRQVLVPHLDASGAVAGYSALLQDLSEQFETAERLRAIADTVPVGVFFNDPDGRCEWVNATYCQMTGRRAETLLGDGWRDVLLPESADLPERAATSLTTSGRFGPVQVAFRGHDGARRIASTRIGTMFAPDGAVRGYVGVVADITETRAQQDALARSEERFRAVLGAMEEGVVMQDAAGQIVLWNAAAERILGLTGDQLRGATSTDPRWRTIDAEGHPLPGDQHPAMVTLRTGRPISGFIMGVARPDQPRVWIRVSATPILLPGAGAECGVVVSFVDITETRLAEEMLRRSEQQLRQVTDAAREAICLHEPDGRYHWVSEAAREVLGWEPHALIGRDPYAFFHPDDIERVRRESHDLVLAGAPAAAITYRFRRQDRTYTWLETATAVVPPTPTSPMRLVTTSRTVDARMAADVRNARRQRLGGVTHFAGRLAHDFTNLYTVLQSRLELMRDRLEGDVRHDLEAAFEAVERATELVRDLRALGGREAMALEPARLERLVEDMLPILRARASVRLQWRPAAGDVSLPVLADRAALEATLLTLVRNASEATSAEVEIALSVEAVHLDVPLVELHGEVPPGDWAVVRCRDNGPGISDAVLDRIFEPDFSSKGEQVETGLGLPVALARMQRMLGHLSVARHDDGGTLVSLWLPITRAVPVEAASGEATPVEATSVEATSVEATSVEATSVEATPAKAVPVEARSRLEARDAASSDCRARVLLVDDDVLVLRTAQRLLERAGFCVRTAAGGAEAERCLDDAREPIDVIVTDVVMPGLSGPALIARRRAGGDARPVVFMSGYTSDAMPVAPLPEASAPLVAKPFTTTTLVSAIQRAITGAGPAA